MPSIARLQLLRAALELTSFTAKDLADETAIPLESIRTMLKRHPELVGDAGEKVRVASARRSGRPARCYQLRDPDAVRRELESLDALPGLGGPSPPQPRSGPQRDESVLDLALANLQAALTEGVNDGNVMAARIDTAQRTANVVLEREGSEPRTQARAHEYVAASHITRGLLLYGDDQEQMTSEVQAAAEHGVAALALDPETGWRVTRLLLAAASKTGIDPPIAETITSPLTVSGLFHGEVQNVTVADHTFRVPRYAASLMRARSPASVVFRVGDQDTEETVQRTLEHLDALNVPTFVALTSQRDGPFIEAVQRIALNTATYWMPFGMLQDLPTKVFSSAVDKFVDLGTNRSVLKAIESLPQRVP